MQTKNLENMKQVFWASVTFTAIKKSKLGNGVKPHGVKPLYLSFHNKITSLSDK